MTVLLGFLLVVAVVGLVFLGYHAFKLHIKAVGMEADLAAQQARHDQEIGQWNDNCTNLKGQVRGLVHKYNEDAKRWHDHAAALKAENQRLSKWKDVADAEVKAAAMVVEAQATLEKAKADADNLTSSTQQQATTLLAEADQQAKVLRASANDTASAIASEAKGKAKTLKDEAQALLDSVTAQASKIIEAANKKAEEVGGSAYEAMRNATLYEQTL